MEAIRNIKWLKFFLKVITIPNGYYGLREPGNIRIHKGIIYYISTCVRVVNGKIEYSLHWWTVPISLFLISSAWVYKGKIKMDRQGEDAHLIFLDDRPHIYFEDKTREQAETKWHINHYSADNMNDEFTPVWNDGYTPAMTGIQGCVAVYSWLSKDANRAFCDWRELEVKPHTEHIGDVKREADGKWGSLETILRAEDYGYQSLGVGGSAFEKLDTNYDVLETAGLIDWSPENPQNHKWVNGLMERDRRTNKWKMLNKALKDHNGKLTRASFFKVENKWYAMCTQNGVNMYLAELITEGSLPSNGGSMDKPINLEFDKSTKTLSWGYQGGNVDKFDIVAEHNPPYNWIGHALSTDRYFVVPEQYIRKNSQFFQVVAVKGNDKGFSDKLIVSHNSTPEPEPNDNTAYIYLIRKNLETVEHLLTQLKPQ